MPRKKWILLLTFYQERKLFNCLFSLLLRRTTNYRNFHHFPVTFILATKCKKRSTTSVEQEKLKKIINIFVKYDTEYSESEERRVCKFFRNENEHAKATTETKRGWKSIGCTMYKLL